VIEAPAQNEANAALANGVRENTVRLTLYDRPFDRRHRHLDFAPGPTIAELLLASDFPEQLWPFVHVFVADHEIPRGLWHRVRPKAGAPLTALIVPGRGGRGILSIVATIAIIAFAAWAAPAIASSVGLVGAEGAGATFLAGSTGAKIVTGLIGGVITVAGGLLTSALIPPPSAAASSPVGFGASASLSSPTYQITGVQNRSNPYGPIPRVFGERRVFPVLGARAYTETLGDKRYFRLLLVAGYGPLSLDEIRIGNTPIEAFSNVEIAIREGWPDDAPRTLFTRRISETQLTVALTQAAGWRTTRTETASVSASLDVSFDRGLVYYNAEGGTSSRTVAFEAEYRAAGSTGAWTQIVWDAGSDVGFASAGLISVQANSTSAVRRGGRFTFPATGEYDVRVRRTTTDSTDARTVDQSTWTALRSVRADAPMAMPGMATIELRIEAYEQLNNQLQEISCRARSWHRVWNGSTWSWLKTRNPAWHCTDLLTRRGVKTMLADSRIDWAGFKVWADANDVLAQDGQPKWRFDGVIEGGSTGEAFATIAAHGRARQGFSPDGKYSVVRDVAQTVPALHVTPRNSYGYRGRRDLRDLPHAVRVRFSDPAIDYQENEVVVYADGQSAATAEEFDTLDMYGATSSAQAWREGRYHLAVANARRETHETFQDIESLRATDGDLVMFAHDVVAIGLSHGRILSATTSGANTTGFVLDEEITLETGKSYALRVRRKNGDSQVLALATIVGTSKTATLAAALATSLAPEPGDLFLFGEAGLEAAPMIVKGIEPGPNLTAKLVLLAAAPAIHDADTGPIPAFESFATPRILETPKPVGLFLAAGDAELARSADGTIEARLRVRWNLPSAVASLEGIDVEIQWRRSDAPNWTDSRIVAGRVSEYFIGRIDESRPAEGVRIFYDVRVRTLARLGQLKSDWVPGSVEAIGKTEKPPRVVGARLSQGRVWGALDGVTPLDFAGFRIKYNRGADRNYAVARQAHATPTVALPWSVGPDLAGRVTLFVVGVDTSGNESAEPATIVVDLGDEPIANIVETLDFKAAAFPGTVANGSLSGGDLVATDDGGLYLANPDALYLPDSADLYLPVAYLALSYEFGYVPGPDAIPSTLTLDVAAAGEGVAIEFDPDDQAQYLPDGLGAYLPSGPGAYLASGGGWRPWPGAVEAARQLYRFRVSMQASASRGRISAATLRLDVPDQEEEIADLVVPIDGVRLPLAKTYRSIRTVIATFQDDGGSAETLRVVDKNAELGPLVKAFAGVAASAARADFRIKGVAR
jgi:hypothetical protein